MITVLIPAHNEEKTIAKAIQSVREQTRSVDKIYVIADNCTDATAKVAKANGALVYETLGNHDKKAGALNQVLRWMLFDYNHYEHYILVMDADSYLDSEFVEVAEEWLRREDDEGNRIYGGIGGTFRGRIDQPTTGLMQRWVTHAQSNEYARYARDVNRKNGRVLVLTGTATLFNAKALEDVAIARQYAHIPGGGSKVIQVYDTSVLTEDNELTLALKHLGWKVKSPDKCTLSTEVMPTWRDLFRQRLRWKRGAMENLVQYGVTRHTLLHWGYQIVGFFGVMITMIYFATLALSIWAGTLHLQWLWIAVTGIFVAERVVTVSKRGTAAMLVASVLVIEMIYDMFLQVVHVRALADALTRRQARW